MDFGELVLILLGVFTLIIILIAIVAKTCIIIVRQGQGVIIEEFAKFHKDLGPGIHFLVPIMHSPREFTWRRCEINPAGKPENKYIRSYRIDLRESVFNFMPQEVYTKDTVLLDVNALMIYNIHSIRKAVYEVDDLQSALSNTAQTQLKEVFGSMTFSEALESQQYINEHISKEFAKVFSGWGVTCHRMELLDIKPKAGQISEGMKRQMVAERIRRGDFIRSEGGKVAMRLRADGDKMMKVNIAIAEQEATRKVSEGDAQARVEVASAESQALMKLAASMKRDNQSQSEYMIAQRYLDFFRVAADRAANKTIYLPYDVELLSGLIHTLPGAIGSHRTRAAATSDSRAQSAPKGDEEFGELD